MTKNKELLEHEKLLELLKNYIKTNPFDVSNMKFPKMEDKTIPNHHYIWGEPKLNREWAIGELKKMNVGIETPFRKIWIPPLPITDVIHKRESSFLFSYPPKYKKDPNTGEFVTWEES